MRPRLKSICRDHNHTPKSALSGDGWLRRWGWGLAHGVQADVADGMVLSAGWLLHDEHPLTVPCAQHSSMSCHRPQSPPRVWCGSQASELRDIQRGGEDAAYRKASGATTLSYSVPAHPPEPGQCLVDSWPIVWLALRLQKSSESSEPPAAQTQVESRTTVVSDPKR